MPVQTARRLPGFRFQVQPPPLVEVLPRMDVAVFVGFAAAGPLHTAVPLEDAAHFDMVFGDDAPLAWDPESGEIVCAYLAPAVRAFFRNGGKRCWVVRVAGPGATANDFAIPGLVQTDEKGRVRLDNEQKPMPIRLQARSAGSWSDNLEVAAELASETMTFVGWETPGPSSPPTGPAESRRAFCLTLDPQSAVARGDVLRLTFLEERPHETLVLLLAVPAAAGRDATRITGGTALWFRADDPARPLEQTPAVLPVTLSGVERLTFDLRVRQGQEASWCLRGLGFAPGHPRYWGLLPTDEQLYDAAETFDGRQRSEFWDDAASPRFPLAATTTSAVCLPVGMPLVAKEFARADLPATTDLDRDGLAQFDASLFFDARDPQAFRALIEAGAENLLAEADFLRYQGTSPRRLGGLFAALDIDEATLIAIPDAVHRGWSPTVGVPFASPVESQPPARPEWWHFLPCPPAEPLKRVRQPEPGHFLDCDLRFVPPPGLSAPQEIRTPAKFTITWTSVADALYVLEESTSREFIDAVTIYRGPDLQHDVLGREPGDYYYRVRAEVAKVSSDFSNGAVVRVLAAARWQLNPLEEYSDLTLLAVQRTALRLCAARADIFTVLALPAHYREDDAISHASVLASPIGPEIKIYINGLASMDGGNGPAGQPGAVCRPMGVGEAGAFSYGALYHPWLVGREENSPDALRQTPPDGAAAGIMARRALARGAWTAPANESFQDVVALTPPIGRRSRLNMLEAQINLLRREPHGLVAQSADTLSGEADLRPINVRRLLILLRRLALRLGAAYAFEPNDDSLRRSVERSFEAQLEFLFVRGAFAGATPETSFQVVVGDSVNTRQSVDQGRFIVELRVAPSVPLTFLTIRLVQTGDRGFVTEVR